MHNFEQLYIGGEWVNPAGTNRFEVINPATEELIGSTPEGSAADIDRAVEAANAALVSGEWAGMAAAERAEVMGRLLGLFSEKADDLANLIT
ncbi:MAG: aldehyde dehydrogenase family protein, partial [Microthrixaceae bacterium]